MVFPVSLDSMASAETLGSDSDVMQQLQMVPGPASGEGCSTSGGCASCPYMKMNTLTSLLRVCELVGTSPSPCPCINVPYLIPRLHRAVLNAALTHVEELTMETDVMGV